MIKLCVLNLLYQFLSQIRMSDCGKTKEMLSLTIQSTCLFFILKIASQFGRKMIHSKLKALVCFYTSPRKQNNTVSHTIMRYLGTNVVYFWEKGCLVVVIIGTFFVQNMKRIWGNNLLAFLGGKWKKTKTRFCTLHLSLVSLSDTIWSLSFANLIQ